MKLFAGPCSLESKELCFEVARTIRDILPSDIDYYFKTSFAKENRSSSTSSWDMELIMLRMYLHI